MVQQVDSFTVGDSIEVTAVYIGGWWVLPISVLVLVLAALGVLWWARRRRGRDGA